MRYITDQQAAQLPGLAGAAPERRTQVLANAARIYRAVSANQWASDGELRLWAERDGMSVDDTNEAIQVLVDAGKLLDLNAPEEAAVVVGPDLSGLTVADLQGVFEKTFGEPPSSDLKKADLVLALHPRREALSQVSEDAPVEVADGPASG